MKKTIPFICILLFVFAQSEAQEFQPLPESAYQFKSLQDYKKFIDSVADANTSLVDKKIRKDYNEIISTKNNDLVNEISDGNFLFDDKIYPYLHNIFQSILIKNGLNNHVFHFLVSRSASVNAYSFEDCTIVCNLGLLNIIENESQLSMVFCHEIAHYMLAHSNESITNQLEKYNSDEFRSQVKAIKKEKYNIKSKLENILTEDVFNRRKHNRHQELAADSLGMLLFLKTGYNAGSVPRLYDLLNESESEPLSVTIRSFLEKQGVKVNDSWLDAGKKITFGKSRSKEIIDSLKTHPDCSIRKVYASNFFASHSISGYDFKIGTKESLADIRKLALFEQAIYSRYKNKLSYYLYQLIQDQAQYEHNRFLATEIFNVLLNFTIAQTNHSLYQVVEKPYSTTDDTDEYAKLLKLLESVDLKELANITLSNYKSNQTLIDLNTETSTNLEKIKQF